MIKESINSENRNRHQKGDANAVVRPSSRAMTPGNSTAQSSAETKSVTEYTTNSGKINNKEPTMPKTATHDKPKRLTLNLPPDVHKAFKLYCTEKGVDMTTVIKKYIHRCINRRDP